MMFVFFDSAYSFSSSRYCGMLFQSSIALNEIICLPVFVLTRGLYIVLIGCISSIVVMDDAQNLNLREGK